jgi:hypothetical protein
MVGTASQRLTDNCSRHGAFRRWTDFRTAYMEAVEVFLGAYRLQPSTEHCHVFVVQELTDAFFANFSCIRRGEPDSIA